MSWFINFLAARYNLTAAQARRALWIFLGVVGTIVLVVLLTAGKTAAQAASTESVWWEVVILLRTSLVRLTLAACIGVPLGSLLGFLIVQALELTELGKRYLVWAEGDTPETRAAKTRNAGQLVAALQVAGILALTIGVLR